MADDIPNDLLTKDEAAALLGVSTRAVARHAASGRLQAQYHKQPRGGERVYYSRAEVEALRSALTRPRTATTGQDAITARAVKAVELAEVVAMAVRAAVEQIAPATTAVPVADKLLLTLDEAAALTGLSIAALEERRLAGALRAVELDGAWRVSRRDLLRFVRAITRPAPKRKRGKGRG